MIQSEKKSQADRAAVLDSAAGGCCIFSGEEERILYVNGSVLFSYACPDQETFLRMTGGCFRGMVEAEDYRPLQDFFEAGRTGTERKEETADGCDNRPAEGENRLRWKAEGYRYLTYRFRTLDGQEKRAQAFLWRSDLPSAGEVWAMNLIPSALIQRGWMQDRFTGLMGMHDFYEKVLDLARQDRREGRFGSRVQVSFNIVNFKEYNRMFGVQAGDECIWIVADTLRRVFPGQPLAHISADRFCAYVEKDEVCQKIEAACSRGNRYIRNHGISLKAGICDPGAGAGDEEVRQAADHAKIACDSIRDDANRCWAVYTPDMGERIEWNTYILQHFEEALEKQYIKVYFQPIVRTLTGRLCGCEALARWEDPEKGMIMPGIFIPVLERSRLISRLDTYVVRQVCAMQRARMEKGQKPIPVSVNLALDDFVQTDICGLAERETAANGLPRECLRFEITESTLAGNSSAVREGVKRLHSAGYQVWLDDFGSQYSSLNSLHDFEFDEIKLDMNFFRNFNEQSRKILTGISDMAKALGIHTVAEGVETPEQVAFLHEIGCGKIQGYYYGRPVSCGEVEKKSDKDRLVPENERENQMYDATDLIRVAGAMPVGLVHICGQTMDLLFANDSFLGALRLSGTSGLQKARGDIQADWHPMHRKWLSFFARVYSSSRDEHITYVDNGQYFRMEARRLSGEQDDWLAVVHLYQVTEDRSGVTAGRHSDISPQDPEEKSDALRREETVSGLMAAAMKESEPESGICLALDGVRNLLQADCVLVLEEQDGDVMHCTYERTKAGIPARMPALQKIDREVFSFLKEQQREDGCVVIPDFDQYRKQHPEMTDEDIHSLTACAMEAEGLSAGWLAAINGKDAAREENVRIVREMSGFLSGLLQNRDRIQHLRDLCLRDQLTGVMNRLGYEQYVIRLTGTMEPGTEDQSVALIFGDINGLKETNDTGGHRAGDDLIRRAADTLVRFSDRDHVFRMGGDEFVLIAENCGNAGAEKLIRQIQQENARKGVSMSLGYGVQKRNELESDTLILSAESRMYNRKSEYHRAAGAQMHSS